MFIRTVEDLKGTKGEVKTNKWSSCRLLHHEDGMGVTLTDAILETGMDQIFWYQNHLESVYCLEGSGTLEDLATGKTYPIKPGTLYALDKHDRHRLKVTSRMRVICAFVPPLVGGEIHDAQGSYPMLQRLAEVREIENIATRMSSAFNEGDAAKLAWLYEPDAVLMPPNEPMVRGREAIRLWFEGVLKRVSKIEITPIESCVCGDFAFQAGRSFSRSRISSANASATTPPPVNGKFILTLRRIDGDWKIQYDIWNLDTQLH